MLLGDRQHRDRRRRGSGADRDVDAVILIGLGQRGLGEIGLALVVLDDDVDLAPVDLHGSLGRVFEAEPQPGLRLLGVGLQRPGAAMDQGDLEIIRPRGHNGRQQTRRDGESLENERHGCSPEVRGRRAGRRDGL